MDMGGDALIVMLSLSHKPTWLWVFDGFGITQLTLILQFGSLESRRAEEADEKKKMKRSWFFNTKLM